MGNLCKTRSTDGQWIRNAVEAQEFSSQAAGLYERSHLSRQTRGGYTPKLISSNLSTAASYQLNYSSPHYSIFYQAQLSKDATRELLAVI